MIQFLITNGSEWVKKKGKPVHIKKLRKDCVPIHFTTVIIHWIVSNTHSYNTFFITFTSFTHVFCFCYLLHWNGLYFAWAGLAIENVFFFFFNLHGGMKKNLSRVVCMQNSMKLYKIKAIIAIDIRHVIRSYKHFGLCNFMLFK